MMINIWTVVLALCNALFIGIFYYRRKRLSGEPPLVTQLIPFVGGALAFGQDPIGYLKKLQKKFGNVFSLELAGWNYHVIMHPLDVKYLEKCRTLEQKTIIGNFSTRLLGPEHSVYNQNQPSNEDSDAFQQRNKVVPRAIKDNLRGSSQLKHLFQSCVQNTVKIIEQVMEEKIQLREKDNTMKLHELCKNLIYHMSHNIMLGTLPDDEENLKEAKAIYHHFSKFNKSAVLLQDRVPIHALPGTKKARSEILKLLKSMNICERDNVSDMILQVLDSDTNEENQIRHLMLLLWTGQANTTPGLFWSLFYIFKHPDVRQEILKEFESLINSKEQEDSFDDKRSNLSNPEVRTRNIARLEKNDLDKLVVLEATLKEVMRITGSTMNVRKASADTILKTHDNKRYNIRKGDYTMFYSPIMHFDPEIYQDPEKFIFDRYLDKTTTNHSDSIIDGKTKSLTVGPTFSKNRKEIHGTRSILTFGFGGGQCPGRHLAIMEIKLLILSLLTCFDPKLLSDHTPKADLTHIGFGIMPPATDVLISLEKKM